VGETDYGPSGNNLLLADNVADKMLYPGRGVVETVIGSALFNQAYFMGDGEAEKDQRGQYGEEQNYLFDGLEDEVFHGSGLSPLIISVRFIRTQALLWNDIFGSVIIGTGGVSQG
jgi:hypothetical protein